MERNVIFSKQVRSGDSSVGFVIECESPVNLSISAAHSISILESIHNGVPVVVASFTDSVGDLVLVKNLDSTAKYQLTVTVGDEEPIALVPLKIAAIEMTSTVEYQAKGIVCEVTFVHESWYDFCLETHTRGWSNTRYSDIVSEITGGGDIAETLDSPESVVQPYWTNSMLLDWISKRCVSSSGDGDYVYGIRLDGDFFFKPYSHLIEDNESFTVPTLFSIKSKPHRNYKQGESGVHSIQYNYDRGRYQPSDVVYNGGSSVDWSLIDSSAPVHLPMMHGRNKEAERISTNRVYSVANSSQAIDVTVEAANGVSVRIGQVVDLQFTAFNEFEVNSSFSENNSGKYVVAQNKTVITQTRRGKVIAHSELTLVRPGFNDSERQNFIRG